MLKPIERSFVAAESMLARVTPGMTEAARAADAPAAPFKNDRLEMPFLFNPIVRLLEFSLRAHQNNCKNNSTGSSMHNQ
jgi:hypothetical protein